MLSTVDTKENDPHDAVEVVPDVVQLARVAAEFPKLAPEEISRIDPHAASAALRPRPEASRPETPRPETPRPEMPKLDVPRIDTPNVGVPKVELTPRVDTTFRATDVNAQLGGRSRNRWAARAAMAFVFALASGVGAAAWERYGADAQALLDNYRPSFTLASLLPSSLLTGKPATATTSVDTAAAPAVVDQETQPAAPAAAAAQPVAPTPAAVQPADTTAAAAAAAPSPDTAQLIQSMSHDVATLTQQLDDLKASIAQLKAGQEQLTRELANKTAEAKVAEARETREVRAAEPNPHIKLGAPPRSLGTIVRRPPPRPPAQAAYMPPPQAAPPPVQIAPPAQVPGQPDADYTRPPMPVR
jgi:hypothetical protein